jgi:hypothetical protein
MERNWFKYDGRLLRTIGKEIGDGLGKNRAEAAKHVKKAIKRKALAVKITGNLAKGVYMKNDRTASFVGLRAPAFHNFLLEFGHRTKGKFVPPHPIVYPTFEEEAPAVRRIMEQPLHV